MPAFTIVKVTGSAVMVADPVVPSVVAVMCAAPAAWAMTSPSPDTANAVGLLLAHCTGRLSTCPAASRTTATICTTPPTTVWTSERTSTVATGAPPGVASHVPVVLPPVQESER
jgi:hypothetical protein